MFAHGAGAGMTHPFMARAAGALAARGIATLRYQFPYMERGSKRPDAPQGRACGRARRGGRSGARPARRAAAGRRQVVRRPHDVAGPGRRSRCPASPASLFLGFPLHPAGKPSIERAQHLAAIRIPMLFVQGTRDEMADVSLIESTVGALGRLATLHWVQDGDHSLRVPARSGRDPAQVLDSVFDAIQRWIENLAEG